LRTFTQKQSGARMMTNNFALFGAKPIFDNPLSLGQFYFPSLERYEAAFQGIFERQYYNNNGPLLNELENKLQEFLGVKHAICVSNATLGMMMVADAMELYGKVVIPAINFVSTAQLLSWLGLKPVFCDIDLNTFQMDINQIDELIDKDVSAIIAANLWGGACNQKLISEFAESKGVQLCFDSAHAFGCRVNNLPIGNFGVAEVFSFNAKNILSAAEGGCICTNDDNIATRLTSIRPSYGVANTVSIVRVANARMSEAQAAIALMNLDDFSENQKQNQCLYQIYETKISTIPGLNIVKPSGVSFSNKQYVICIVDEALFGLSRDLLIEILKAENISIPCDFYALPYPSQTYDQELSRQMNSLPNTKSFFSTYIELPIGALVSTESVERICDLLNRVHQSSAEIYKRLEK